MGRRGLADGRVAADVMCCEAEAGAAALKVRPWPRRTAPPYNCSALYRGKQVRLRAAGGANLCVTFLKALLLAIACDLSALCLLALNLPSLSLLEARGRQGAPGHQGVTTRPR